MKRLLLSTVLLLPLFSAAASEHPLHPGEKIDLALEGGNTLSITLNGIEATGDGKWGCSVNVQKLKFTGATLYSVSLLASEETSDASLGWTASASDEDTCTIKVLEPGRGY